MKTMEVEVVDIRKITGDGNLRAFADVKFGDALLVKGFSVMNGKSGLFVAMPRKASKDGRWLDILTFTNEATKNEVVDSILAAYDKEAD